MGWARFSDPRLPPPFLIISPQASDPPTHSSPGLVRLPTDVFLFQTDKSRARMRHATAPPTGKIASMASRFQEGGMKVEAREVARKEAPSTRHSFPGTCRSPAPTGLAAQEKKVRTCKSCKSSQTSLTYKCEAFRYQDLH